MQQGSEIFAGTREQPDYEEAMLNGLMQGVVGQAAAPAVIAGVRAAKSPVAPERKRVSTITDADRVRAVATTPAEVIDSVRDNILGEGSSDLYKSINLSKIIDTDMRGDTKALLDRMESLPRVSDEDVMRMNQDTDFNTLIKKQNELLANKGIPTTDAGALALRNATYRAWEDTKVLNAKLKELRGKTTPDDPELIKLTAARNDSYMTFEALVQRTRETANNAGRLLAIHRHTMPSNFETLQAMQAVQNNRFTRDIDTHLDNIASGKLPDEKSTGGLFRKGVDMYMEAWYNGILGAPDTLVVNTLGSFANGFIKNAIEKPLAAGIGKTGITRLFGAPREISGTEAHAAMKAFGESWKDALRMAYHFSLSEQPVARLGAKADAAKKKFEQSGLVQDEIAAKYWGELAEEARSIGSSEYADEASKAAHIPWQAGGYIVRAPGRLMGATDAFNKVLGRRAALQSIVHREASKVHPVGSKEYNDFVKDRLDNPFESDLKAASNEAKMLTFQDDNSYSDVIRDLQNHKTFGPAVRLFMPFARTPANLVKWGLQRTPGVGLLSKDVPVEERLGRQLTGMSLMTLGYYMAETGQLSGAGPTDWKQQAQMTDLAGFQPYSAIRQNPVTGETTSTPINRLDPVTWIIQSGVILRDMVNFRRTLEGEERQQADKMIEAFIGEIQKGSQILITERTYLGGLADMMKIATGEGNLSQFAAQTISGVIPNYAARIGQAADEYARQAGKGNNVLSTIGETIQKRTPFWREDLPLDYNNFGRPNREREGGAIFFDTDIAPITRTPIPTTRPEGPDAYNEEKGRADDAPLVDLVVRTGIPKNFAPKVLWNVSLTNREQSYYNYVFGTVWRTMLANNVDALENLAYSGKEGLALARTKIMSLRKTANEMAKEAIIANPDITEARRNLFVQERMKSPVKDMLDPKVLREDPSFYNYREVSK